MAQQKVRTIYTNDGECDDMNTFLHLLLYANDIDLEGIVYSGSKFHYQGIPEKGIPPMRWADPAWMYEYINDYEKVWPNLKAHDPAYPDPDYLRSIVAIGNVRMVSEMEEVTEGSELIREAILKDKPGKLYVQIGGGTSTVARALRSIEEEYRDSADWGKIRRKVSDTLVIVMIVTQDDTYRDYISPVWPDVQMIHCMTILPVAFLYGPKGDPVEALECFSAPWMKEHLLDKGAFMARYHTWGDGHHYDGEEPGSQFGDNPDLLAGNWWGHVPHTKYDMISEGDSPSFLYLLDRGLRSLEDPSWGGWGGRYERTSEHDFDPRTDYWLSAEDESCGQVDGKAYALSRWIADWMNDFAARASWTQTADRLQTNHCPLLQVDGGLERTAGAGEEITLHVCAEDPDGDAMRLTFWRYAAADRYRGQEEIRLESSQSADGRDGTVRFTVPEDASAGDTIHLMVTCRDSARGEHPEYMAAYARAVITVQ
ncbi:DUF1593 domain-containing protein [Lachnoclostridium sp. Marseille-P6806]|uniref:DUF1593 domain-containing protein n=1 Tax=Lachnoclostridium sp. Marseille-P6806 TaxID=2364793 RepID=UPI00103125C9|nr:DUF1593 domain-containing protein [Lachnoclostridium sp. Marseille-P6806]